MAEEEEKDYGKVTIGYGSSLEQELQVSEFIQATYKDNRLVTVSKLEDDTYVLMVENPQSSGRHPQSIMRLSKESFVGLISSAMLYANLVGWDLESELKKALDSEDIHFSASDNLKIKKDE